MTLCLSTFLLHSQFPFQSPVDIWFFFSFYSGFLTQSCHLFLKTCSHLLMCVFVLKREWHCAQTMTSLSPSLFIFTRSKEWYKSVSTELKTESHPEAGPVAHYFCPYIHKSHILYLVIYTRDAFLSQWCTTSIDPPFPWPGVRAAQPWVSDS